jgi:hypothetical protein
VDATINLWNEVMSGEGFDLNVVKAILQHLPTSVGGRMVISSDEVAEALGVAQLTKKYKELEIDDPVSIVIFSENGKAPWTEYVPWLAKEVKKPAYRDSENPEDEILEFFEEAGYKVLEGAFVRCVGWREGTSVDDTHHSCGNVMLVKEAYHSWRCKECTKALTKFRKNGKKSTRKNARLAIQALRLRRR